MKNINKQRKRVEAEEIDEICPKKTEKTDQDLGRS